FAHKARGARRRVLGGCGATLPLSRQAIHVKGVHFGPLRRRNASKEASHCQQLSAMNFFEDIGSAALKAYLPRPGAGGCETGFRRGGGSGGGSDPGFGGGTTRNEGAPSRSPRSSSKSALSISAITSEA